MSIKDRDLKPGTKLVARYKGQEHTAEVVKTDGREFKSPSSAGSAVTGHACNGWAFWSLPGTEPKVPKKAKAKEQKPAGFRKLEDGRFWCDACADAFKAPAGVVPIGCPQGHEPAQPAAA
jgi:hypothetical protein